jgi:hypothetical protein
MLGEPQVLVEEERQLVIPGPARVPCLGAAAFNLVD